MDQYVIPYCVIYDMDQSILNSVFKKSVATGITTVATGIDNSYVVMDIDDVIMPVTTILLFKCARAPKF
jgi:hypothetical protein